MHVYEMHHVMAHLPPEMVHNGTAIQKHHQRKKTAAS